MSYKIPKNEIKKNPQYVECIFKPHAYISYTVTLEGNNILQNLDYFFMYKEKELTNIFFISLICEYFTTRNIKCSTKIKCDTVWFQILNGLFAKLMLTILNGMYMRKYKIINIIKGEIR